MQSWSIWRCAVLLHNALLCINALSQVVEPGENMIDETVGFAIAG